MSLWRMLATAFGFRPTPVSLPVVPPPTKPAQCGSAIASLPKYDDPIPPSGGSSSGPGLTRSQEPAPNLPHGASEVDRLFPVHSAHRARLASFLGDAKLLLASLLDKIECDGITANQRRLLTVAMDEARKRKLEQQVNPETKEEEPAVPRTTPAEQSLSSEEVALLVDRGYTRAEIGSLDPAYVRRALLVVPRRNTMMHGPAAAMKALGEALGITGRFSKIELSADFKTVPVVKVTRLMEAGDTDGLKAASIGYQVTEETAAAGQDKPDAPRLTYTVRVSNRDRTAHWQVVVGEEGAAWAFAESVKVVHPDAPVEILGNPAPKQGQQEVNLRTRCLGLLREPTEELKADACQSGKGVAAEAFEREIRREILFHPNPAASKSLGGEMVGPRWVAEGEVVGWLLTVLDRDGKLVHQSPFHGTLFFDLEAARRAARDVGLTLRDSVPGRTYSITAIHGAR